MLNILFISAASTDFPMVFWTSPRLIYLKAQTQRNRWKAPELWEQKDNWKVSFLHSSFQSLLIDLPLADNQRLRHFHQVVSALDESFSSPRTSPLCSFFSHQLRRCLMSSQVRHALVRPSSSHQPQCRFLTCHLYSLSSCPLWSLTRLELVASQPLYLFRADICHLFCFCSVLKMIPSASLCLKIWLYYVSVYILLSKYLEKVDAVDVSLELTPFLPNKAKLEVQM